MAGKSKAVALAGAHGSKGIEAGVKYCPLEHRANQRAVILAHLKRRGSISTAEARCLRSDFPRRIARRLTRTNTAKKMKNEMKGITRAQSSTNTRLNMADGC